MATLNYLSGYAPELQEKIQQMIEQDSLRAFLQKKHPGTHNIRSDAALRDYTLALKNRFMKKSAPLSKVAYDNKIHVIHGASERIAMWPGCKAGNSKARTRSASAAFSRRLRKRF